MRGIRADSVRVNLADDGFEFGQPVEQLMVSICAWASVLLARWEDTFQSAANAVIARVYLGAFDFSLAAIATAQSVDFFASVRGLAGPWGRAHVELEGLRIQSER